MSDQDPNYLSRISSGPFQSKEAFDDDPRKAKSRFLKVQRITDQYWKIWQRDYFPTLIVRRKWHHLKRSLEVGDICKLKDSKSLRGEWRLCKVVKVHPDKNDVVRNVDVEVAARYDGSNKYKFQQPSVLSRLVSSMVVLLPATEVEL